MTDPADLHRKKRLEHLIKTKLDGNRRLVGVSKGRVSQLLDPEEAFGERAARNLEAKLGLPKRYFELDDKLALTAPGHLPIYHLEPIEEKVILYFRRLSSGQQAEFLRHLGSVIDGSLLLAKKTLKGTLKHVPDARIEQTYGLPGKKVKPQ